MVRPSPCHAASRSGAGGIGADVKARVRAARPQPGSAIGSGVGPRPPKGKAAPAVTASTTPAEPDAEAIQRGSQVPTHCLRVATFPLKSCLAILVCAV